jgi:hypothetical protein
MKGIESVTWPRTVRSAAVYRRRAGRGNPLCDAVVAESKHSFNLFFHKSLFHPIPKRCFRQPEDIGRFRTLLKQVFGTKASVS